MNKLLLTSFACGFFCVFDVHSAGPDGPPPPPPPKGMMPPKRPAGMGALFADINRGATLKKTETNDRSAPRAGGGAGSNASSENGGSAPSGNSVPKADPLSGNFAEQAAAKRGNLNSASGSRPQKTPEELAALKKAAEERGKLAAQKREKDDAEKKKKAAENSKNVVNSGNVSSSSSNIDTGSTGSFADKLKMTGGLFGEGSSTPAESKNVPAPKKGDFSDQKAGLAGLFANRAPAKTNSSAPLGDLPIPPIPGSTGAIKGHGLKGDRSSVHGTGGKKPQNTKKEQPESNLSLVPAFFAWGGR